MTLGGALPIELAVLGIALCVGVSILSSMSTTGKVFSCIGITVGAWMIAFVFAILMLFANYM